MQKRTYDCALLIMLAMMILFFIITKIMINDCLQQLYDFRAETQFNDMLNYQPFGQEVSA